MARINTTGFGALALLVSLFATPLAALAQAPAPAAQQPPPNREFTVQNETDLILQNLYVFPPNGQDRGADRLGSDVVQPGGNFRVRLGRTRDCTFDIVAIYQDGTEDLRRRVDICRNQRQVYGDPSLPTLNVAITNASQVMLRELYVSARGAEAWGPDRLGAGVIDPGANLSIRLRTRDCVFDLRAVYGDDREEVKARTDLCANRAISFDRSGIPRPPSRPLEVLNRHLVTVQELYISDSTETEWGPDRLGANVLERGSNLPLTVETGCEVDVRIVFPNGGAEERREVNICDTPRLVFAPGWVVETAADPGDGTGRRVAGPNALRLRNAGTLPVVELFAFAPGGPRGEDRLGADTLPVGGTFEIDAPGPQACAADLLAVFRDGREVARSGVDLCTGQEVEIQ
jgi:hypothetical protein